MTTRKQLAVGTAPVLVAASLLGGCGGSPHHTAGNAAGSVNERALVAIRQLSSCIRAHGIPGFPDPVVRNDGVPVLPDSAPRVPSATQRACETLAARIPPDYTQTTAVSSNDFQKLVQLARCIRSHGVPDWPDPNALGEFPIDPHIEQGGKRLFVPAIHACARLNPNPSGGVNVVRAHPAP